MGVAPPPAWGRITSLIPRAMGGNLDNKELMPGAKLFLPVFVPGALFSCGDGHGVQGDGEVCVTAIETALKGRFKLTLRKDLQLDYPRAETPTHYMTMAMDPDLDQCVVRALRDMIMLLGERSNMSREDAYTLCSLAADLRVTQTVNGSKGIHCMIAKATCMAERDRALPWPKPLSRSVKNPQLGRFWHFFSSHRKHRFCYAEASRSRSPAADTAEPPHFL